MSTESDRLAVWDESWGDAAAGRADPAQDEADALRARLRELERQLLARGQRIGTLSAENEHWQRVDLARAAECGIQREARMLAEAREADLLDTLAAFATEVEDWYDGSRPPPWHYDEGEECSRCGETRTACRCVYE